MRSDYGGYKTLSELVYLHDSGATFQDLLDPDKDVEGKQRASERVLSAFEEMRDRGKAKHHRV